MDKLKIDADEREPYEPPVIEDVPLHADEQLLAGCKTGSGPGRNQPCTLCKAPVLS